MSENKIALVTGAGSGIGKHVALGLMESGYSVVLSGRRKQLLEEVAAHATAQGWSALVIPADVSKPADVKALFLAIQQTFGRLDLLFNNAGIFPSPASLEDISYEQWKSAVDINLSGAFLCMQEAFRLMKHQQPKGGRIINNGSISAHVPRPHSAAYTATKHALTGLTKAAALDGRKYDIACGQIDIGNASSDMTARMSTGIQQANGSVETEPVMQVEHVVGAVRYMAGLPLDANVQFMTVMATKMPYIGRG